MVLDKETGWLYVVDNGNDRVLRLDIHSGNVINSLPLINEPLAEYSQMGNVVWEVIIDSLTRPSGIDLIENRLLVGDFTTGEISIYDVDNGFSKLGAIPTGQAGLTGIKVGPDGAIWCTNRTQNTLVKIEPGEISAVEVNPLLALITISPNPSSGIINVTMPEERLFDEVQFSLKTLEGKSVMVTRSSDQHLQLDLMDLPAGLYLLNISDGSSSVTRKIILTH